MPGLDRLPLRPDRAHVHAVVECPAGSRLKFAYDPALGAMTLSRALVLGLAYPCHWGFLPSTLAADGDPLDVLVLDTTPLFPGVVLPCRVIGVLRATQAAVGGRRRIANDRILAVLHGGSPLTGERDARRLPAQLRRELEAFFRQAVLFAGKRLRLRGWGGLRSAVALIAAAEASFRRHCAESAAD
jgi:inorganic pyrophosphatase